MYCEAQVPLMLEKKTTSGSRYEIDPEGIRFLRSLETKRLRIVFNVSTTLDITTFSVLFCKGNLIHSSPVRNDDLLSCLTIMKNIEVMDTDQVLITLNARHKTSNTNYLLLGYLISSVILFHNNGQVEQNSDLLVLLSTFHQQLKHTNIKDLQAEMRFASGFDKKPYLVCVCHNVDKDNSQAKDRFLNFFNDIDSNSTTHSKKSLDVLLDYLPNRTSFYLSSLDTTLYARSIQKIKISLQATVIDRKIFNFQVTGAALQSLVLELCQIFNQSPQKVDLVALYIQVINYMKRRVLTQSLDFYLRRVACMISTENMPYNPEQMLELHQKVVDEVHAHTCVMALHCMNLIEYVSVWEEIHTKIEEVFLDLEISNGKASQQFNMVLKEELMGLQLQDLDLVHEEVVQKIDTFSYNSRGNDSKDQLGELCKSLLGVYSQQVTRKVRQLQGNRLDLQIGTYQLTGRVGRLQDQNAQLIMRHQLNLDQREASHLKPQQNPDHELQEKYCGSVIAKYETTIGDLEESLLKKQAQIDDLRSRLEECESKLSKDKSKPHGQSAFLVKQLRSCLKDFDKMFVKVQKTDDMVKSARKEIEKRKQEFLQERDKWVLKIQKLKGEKVTLVKSQQELRRVIVDLEEVVGLFQQIVQYNKDSLEKNADDVALGRVSRAEMETKLLIYRKCIELICQGHKKGKNDSLVKFLKLVQCQDIREFVLDNIRK